MTRDPHTQVPYYELAGLEHVYLEDSYVLEVRASSDSVEFELDVVLTPEHALYHPPPPREQYCMRQAVLRFSNANITRAVWSGAPPAIDAAGEVDYGNIDVLYRQEEAYFVSGEWGEIELMSDPPILVMR